MGRKKRRWRKWKKRRGLVNPSLGRLVAWAEWTEEDKPRERKIKL